MPKQPIEPSMSKPDNKRTIYRKFKGSESEYVALHQWVYRVKGSPSVCEKCGTESSKRMDWANVSGEYKKVPDDWIRLCRKCHFHYDEHTIGGPRGEDNPNWNGDSCRKGHAYTTKNTYLVRKSHGMERQCRLCRNRHARNLYWRRKLEMEKINVQ